MWCMSHINHLFLQQGLLKQIKEVFTAGCLYDEWYDRFSNCDLCALKFMTLPSHCDGILRNNSKQSHLILIIIKTMMRVMIRIPATAPPIDAYIITRSCSDGSLNPGERTVVLTSSPPKNALKWQTATIRQFFTKVVQKIRCSDNVEHN